MTHPRSHPVRRLLTCRHPWRAVGVGLLSLLLLGAAAPALAQVAQPPPGGNGSGTLSLNPGSVTATTTGQAPPSNALAQNSPCSIQAITKVEAASTTAQTAAQTHATPILQRVFQGDNASQIANNCVGSLWPNMGFSIPSIDQLLNSAESYIINTACAMAQSIIQQNTSWLNQSVSFDTGIPGAPVYGVNMNQGAGGAGFGVPPVPINLGPGGNLGGSGFLGGSGGQINPPPAAVQPPVSWSNIQNLFGGSPPPAKSGG